MKAFDRMEFRYCHHVILTTLPPSPFYTRFGVSDPNLQCAKRNPKKVAKGVGMFKAMMLGICMSVGNHQIKKI